MARLKLNEEEKEALIEALNNDIEPNPDLLLKLFPSTAEKFDVVSLDRAKVPTLEYAGKRSEAAILAEASAGIGAAPLQMNRCFGEVKDNEWKNMIVQGDNLQFLKTCYRNEDSIIKDKVKGQVKLIYIDPPFATKSDFGGKEGEYSYTDKADRAVFLETLRERLIYFREILADDGSIYLHQDQKMSHYVKIVTDEVFGKDQFRNEIVWCYNGATNDKKNFVRKHDIILRYSKTNNFIFNADDIRVPYDPETVARFRRNAVGYALNSKDDDVLNNKGKIPEDWWQFCIIRNQAEKMGYPTQKPEDLIERIILASSNKGDLIMDGFAGSGTTLAVAEKLGRRWVGNDFGKHAIYTIQKRILNISSGKKLGAKILDDTKRCHDCKNVIEENSSYKKCDTCDRFFERQNKPAKEKYSLPPLPFCVLSTGAYDFSHVMELREHKDRYVSFVLGLFQLSKNTEMNKKFRSNIIFAEKNGHPVEVYPVWEDEFLKDVRIDEEYLEGILTQSGGKLKGEYYIVTPETCTNVGDTTLKNDNGEKITFRMLTFPYKVLEDVSRKLTLQDQPSKPEDVNQLISSTAFYFNEDVEISVKCTDKGLQITHFNTKILDSQGNRFQDYSGLAMLLVDDEYESGKPFDMDKTVFLKDVKEDGSIAISGLGKNIGVIAIDKHGNESKPVKVS